MAPKLLWAPWLIMLTAVMGLGPVAAQGADSQPDSEPSAACVAAVERAIARRTQCLLGVDATYQRDGNDRRFLKGQERCSNRFVRRFERAKLRHGAENCTSEDASTLADTLDVCVEQARDVATGNSTPAYLFVQSALVASVSDGKLLLEGTDPDVVYFADRPSRSNGTMRLSGFVEKWDAGSPSFAELSPNAELACTSSTDGRNVNLVLALSNPELTLTSPGIPAEIAYDVTPPGDPEGSLPAVTCEGASLFIDGTSGHLALGGKSERITSAAWYNAWYDINKSDTKNIDDMKNNGITDVFLIAGWIDPGWTPYAPTLQQKCSATRPCVGGGTCSSKGKCPALDFSDFYAFVQKNDPSLRIWVQYERDKSAVPSSGQSAAKAVIAQLGGKVGSTQKTILDLIEGVATDFEPPWPKGAADRGKMEDFHVQMAAQLNAKGKRYGQWIGPESLSADFISKIGAEDSVTDFLLIPPMYDRGPNPPDALPPAMYQFLVEAQLGYQAECDTSPCQDQLQLPDATVDIFPLPSNPCGNMVTSPPTSPWSPTCDVMGLSSCSTGLNGYGNYECWSQGGTENCPGTGPLGALLKAHDTSQKIQVLVGAPFFATTSEWTTLKGYNGADMPTWKPDAVTSSNQYPLCVRGLYTTDATTGVTTNGALSGGQGDYIYALGNALNSLLTKESDFAARFQGVYAYGYNDGLEADSVICQNSPCQCQINTTVDSKCKKATQVPIVFMTENNSGDVNRIPQSSWTAWQEVEAKLPSATD